VRLVKTLIAAAIPLALAAPTYALNTTSIGSPVKNVGSVQDLLTIVFGILIGLIGVLAVIFIIIGGIRYILARGDPKATDSARGTITAAIIGLVIALLAVVIVVIVGNILGGQNGFSPTTVGF